MVHLMTINKDQMLMYKLIFLIQQFDPYSADENRRYKSPIARIGLEPRVI